MTQSLKYVVAVSGGVDSVVLLDKLVRENKAELVVAHFDHGIRSDSADDRRFVQALAKQRGLSFEYGQANLGPDASEAKARKARYEFLAKVQKKYRASAIATAHHQDDLIETAIINLLRGTYRKGLSSLSSRPGMLRPLLASTKSNLIDYATKYHLSWREDPTNEDVKYLRNYVRHILVPKLDEADPSWRATFLSRLERGAELNRDIDAMIKPLYEDCVTKSDEGLIIQREPLLELDGTLARELIGYVLKQTPKPPALNAALLKRAWLFSKTAKPGSKLHLSETLQLTVDNGNVLVATKTSDSKVK